MHETTIQPTYTLPSLPGRAASIRLRLALAFLQMAGFNTRDAMAALPGVASLANMTTSKRRPKKRRDTKPKKAKPKKAKKLGRRDHRRRR